MGTPDQQQAKGACLEEGRGKFEGDPGADGQEA